MKQIQFSLILFCISVPIVLKAQDTAQTQSSDAGKPIISGELLTNQRFLLKKPNDWAWNENRLTFRIEKKNTDKSRFYSEIWLRNMGLPDANTSSDLFNKGIVDPVQIEIRELYYYVPGFILKNLDLKAGRQRIAWGVADKFNPTDNLNPLDLEDVMDFGRHRATEALNLTFYINNDLSIQGVWLPFFKPANLPVGVFSKILIPSFDLPSGFELGSTSDKLILPENNPGNGGEWAGKLKGTLKGIDYSLSYKYGYDYIPLLTKNTLSFFDATGKLSVNSELSFIKQHVIGADIAGDFFGAGLWAEAAVFLPEHDVHLLTDLTALIPQSYIPIIKDSLLLEKQKPWVKFVAGGDYHFADNSYLNVQVLHGFFHEKGNENLNNYLFARYEKNFLNDKLKISPLSGAVVVKEFKDIKSNYAIAYMPEISYRAVADLELSLSALIIDGKGENIFANMKDYNMFIMKALFSF